MRVFYSLLRKSMFKFKTNHLIFTDNKTPVTIKRIQNVSKHLNKIIRNGLIFTYNKTQEKTLWNS